MDRWPSAPDRRPAGQGRVEQVGAPRELYEAPATEFVADFLGSANLFAGRVTARAGDRLTIELGGGTPVQARVPGDAIGAGAAVKVLVRPEDVDLVGSGSAAADSDVLRGKVGEVIYLGEMTRVVVETDEGVLVARLAGRRGGELVPGEAVVISWPRAAARVLPSTGDG